MQDTPLNFAAAHRALDELLLAHQEALLQMEAGEAEARLEEFSGHLRTHMRAEEQLLFPVLAEEGLEIPGGRPALFLSEHRKIEKWLGELDRELRRCEGRITPRQAIAILDRESTFKHLLEHHESREEQVLFPTVTRHRAGERIAAIWKQWEAAHAWSAATLDS